MKLREQRNKIKALETSATKLEQELRYREAAFDRVQGSVNKQLEDMLLKEYPDQYQYLGNFAQGRGVGAQLPRY